MLVFVGKPNYSPYASNEIFSVIFRDNMQTGDRVSVIYQWTKDASGKEKTNSYANGTVNKATSRSDGKKDVEIFYNDREKTYYWYKGTVSANSLELSMWNRGGEKVADLIHLQLDFY